MLPNRSISQASLEFSGLFEVEVLLELLLRYWQHPLADNEEFRELLLENAVEVLRVSVAGTLLIEELAPNNMNMIAAIWYAEASAIQQDTGEVIEHQSRRLEWLERVRRSLPSCFCNPENLT